MDALNGLVNSMNTAFGEMVTSALTGMGTILPTVIPVLAALILISIIIRVVRTITG